MKKILAFVLISLFFMNCFSQNKIETVKNVSLSRYLGKWYEIYRMPFKYEKDLMNVTATYSLNEDSTIKVLNEGYVGGPNGEHKIAKGKAKIPDKKNTGRLRVSFFGPFYSDYLIVDLDQEKYMWALVISKKGKLCWILSRKPGLNSEIIDRLVGKAKNLGVDVSKFIKVDHSWK
jgi:lipocalin